jgi:hypothetical protein
LINQALLLINAADMRIAPVPPGVARVVIADVMVQTAKLQLLQTDRP